jgi:hypothetical protein
MYEARARIASWMRDDAAFQQYCDLCTAEYQYGRNAVLAARLARLRDDARGAGGSGYDSSSPPRMQGSDRPTASEFATVHSRMLECVDEGDRARCALTLLLQQLDSFGGYLFGVDDGRHRLLAAVPEDELDPQLEHWFGRYLAEELAPDDAVRGRTRVPFRYVDSHGRAFEPLFLSKPEGLHHRLAAVLVYHASSERRRPSRELQCELAEQLLEHGDVGGAELDVAGTQTRSR